MSRDGFENILDLAKMWKAEGDMNEINQCVVYDTRNSRILCILVNLGFILGVYKTETSSHVIFCTIDRVTGKLLKG